jgi:hypothetical protein
MFLRFISVICLGFLVCLVSSCPKGGDEVNSGSGVGNMNTNSPSHHVTATESDSTEDTGTTTANSTETEETPIDETTTPPPPPAWSIEGVKKGESVRLSVDAENTIVFKFELPKECHWNEDNPLGVAMTFAPEGVAVEPLEFNIPKPADVPSELVFKVKGVKTDGNGDLAFDVMAFFCSDEGFCMRKNDTVSLPFISSDSKEPVKYTVIYKLSIE